MKKHRPLAFLSAIFLILNAQAQVNLPNGLMIHYPFTGNANDVSGNNNNGTANGVTLRPDRANTASASYEFDGVNDNITVPNSTSFDVPADRHSISFWFQLCMIPAANDGNEYYIMAKMNSATNHGWHIFMRRDVGTDGMLRIYYRGINSGNFATQTVCSVPINTVEIGSWHHVVFIIGSNNGTHRSAMLDAGNYDYGPRNSAIAQNTLNFVIGGGVHVWNAATDRYFGLGRLDDIRIYNRAISEPEVTALYNLIPLTSFNQPVSITHNNGLCLSNDSLVITATAQPGLSYSWTGPNAETYTTNPVVIVNPTAANDGVYTLIPNFDGCPRPTLTVTIAPPLPQIALTGPSQICVSSPFNYSVVNNPAATYTWNVPGAGTPTGNTFANPSATTAEAGEYSVTYGLNGCIGRSDTIDLAVVQQYTTTLYDTICQGQSILLGGAQQTTAGAYQDMYQSVNGCDSVVTTNLHVKPLPQVSLGPDQQSCVGSTVTLTATTNGTLTQWSTAETTPTIDVTATGNYWFEAELDGCSARDTINVSFYLNPAANFSAADASQCLDGNSFNFSPDNAFAPGTTFAWAFTGANTPTSTANNPTGIVWPGAGTFAVTLAVVENGCASQPSTVNVTVFPQPVADFVAIPQQGCEPVEVKFNNTTQSAVPYTAAWILGDGGTSTDQSPDYTYVNDGTYNVTVTVTDANGCVDTETKPGFVTVYPQPVAGFSLAEDILTTSDPIIRVTDESVQSGHCVYYLNSGNSLVWNDCSFEAAIPGSGLFTITQVVTSGAGCVDSLTRTFTIRPLPEVFVPNTFTPNGDFVNERFEPSLSWIGDYEIAIFDRWGGVVFQTNDLFTYWNGKLFNYGKDLPQDIYAYRIRYQPYNQKKNYFVTGSVTLVR